MIWGGGISYVAFDIKFPSRQVVFFHNNWDFSNFVPAVIFLKKSHWAELFFYETLVCFRGVAKSSLFDDLATFFSIEFIFTNSAPLKNYSIHFDAQGARQSNGAFDYP